MDPEPRVGQAGVAKGQKKKSDLMNFDDKMAQKHLKI